MEWKPLAAPAAKDFDLGAVTQRSSELETLQNRLQELERRIPRLPPEAFGPPVPDFCIERRTWALTCGLGRKLLPELPWIANRIPPIELIRTRLALLPEQFEKEQVRAHETRLRAWEQQCKSEKSRRTCFKTVTPAPPPKVSFLDRPNGEKTGSITEQLRLLYDAWWSIFNPYDKDQAPAWGPFWGRYKTYVRKG